MAKYKTKRSFYFTYLDQRFKGLLKQNEDNNSIFRMDVFLLEEVENNVEVMETKSFIDTLNVFSPADTEEKKLNATEKAKLQKKIDDYVSKNGAENSAKLIDSKLKIAIDLAIPVDHRLVEQRKYKEITVERLEITEQEKEIGEFKFYFRPTNGIARKAFHNYVKSKKQ